MSYAKRLPDFRVRYQWTATRESVVPQQPLQHMRCDFAYAADDWSREGVYMIWPEFEDEEGQPLPENSRLPLTGTATMWILSDEMRQTVHRARIKVGTRGHFFAGHPIADVEVIAILGLHT